MASVEYTNAVNRANADAGGFVGLAKDALAAATKAVEQVGFGDITFDPISPAGEIPRDLIPVTPNIDKPGLELPDPVGDAPRLQDIPELEIPKLPQNTAVKPTLNFGNMPSGIGAGPGLGPAINTSFVFPEPPAALSAALPTLPSFIEHRVPESPNVFIPSFTSAAPESPDAPPKDGAEIMDRTYAYQSITMRSNVDAGVDAYIRKHSPRYFTQMAAIEAQLKKYLDGGTGLNPAVEDAIYARARSKNNAEARRVRDQALTDAASRGFTMPTGALMSATQQARQAGADNNASAAREIVAMQAEMEQKNLQFAVTATTSIHESMRSAAAAYANTVVSIHGQAVDYAKSTFGNIVELYNASLRYYSTQAEVFKTNASLFETRLRAEMAKLEVFKGEIDAFEALNQADKTKTDVYRARVEAISTLTQAYRAQVETVVSKASLEKLKLDLFQSQVQAYGAQVQAKNSEWSAYTARISGEEAKARIYTAEVGAFNMEVDAFKAHIDAKVSEISSVAAKNQGAIGTFDSKVRAYVAELNANSTKSQAENENNRMVMTEYQKEITAFMATLNADLEKFKADNQINIQNATSGLSAQVELARAKSQYGATLAQLSNDGAQIYGTLAGSAMAGLNTLAALTENL